MSTERPPDQPPDDSAPLVAAPKARERRGDPGGNAYRRGRPLPARHARTLLLVFQGMRTIDVAREMGLYPTTVSHIIHSPPGQAELARLRAEARERLTHRLDRIAEAAVETNERLMHDAATPARVRATIARHFMDRVVFEPARDGDGQAVTYRDLLRALDAMQSGKPPVVAVQVNVDTDRPPTDAAPASGTAPPTDSVQGERFVGGAPRVSAARRDDRAPDGAAQESQVEATSRPEEGRSS